MLGVATVSAAFAYWFAPIKIEERTVEKEVKVEVEKIVYKEKQNNNKKRHTIIIRTKNIDGSITERIEIVESDQSVVEIDKTNETIKVVEKEVFKERIVTKQKALTTASFLVRNPIQLQFKPTYGLMLQRTVLGPINIGAFGYTDKTAGVALGISF